MLNEALSDGDYLYLFDRCLELGNDTVLVKLSQLKNREIDVMELSEAGVRVIINADGTPVNRNLNVAEFLGVTCSSIKFENGYPILYMGEEELDCFYDNNLKEAFLGTVKNDNIVFVGLNLGYHYVLTDDFTLD